jgi:signal transduction histidine kinase
VSYKQPLDMPRVRWEHTRGMAMSQQSPFDDTLHPIAPQAKWWIVGMVFLVLGAWELAFHLWMMDLPMVTGHRLNALIGAGLVAVVVLTTFVLIQRYEWQLVAAAEALQQKSEALQALEAERDTRLVDLAADLALVLTEIIDQCEVALRLSDAGKAPEALAAVGARAHELGAVVRSLVEMKRKGDGLTNRLPAILEEYQRHRDEYLRNQEWYQRYLATHPSHKPYVLLDSGSGALPREDNETPTR